MDSNRPAGSFRIVAVGQLARDLVLGVDRVPPAGSGTEVRLRREMLGGKGANQAVTAAQLGAQAAVVAVVGDDGVADWLLGQARRDGIDVSAVVRREGVASGLIVEVLDGAGHWRYLQHLPDEVLLTEADVSAAAATLAEADAVLVQLQQPVDAAGAAARRARDGGALVVMDGAPGNGSRRRDLPASADVLRADERETQLLTGHDSADLNAIAKAAGDLLAAGPGLVALALPDGNLFAWRDRRWGHGQHWVPLTDETVVDTTGAGDALTAALAVALLRGDPVPDAARYAVAAAGATVGHPGGRPDLSEAAIRTRIARLGATGG